MQQAIRFGAAALGLTLAEEQEHQLALLASLLQHWNKTHSLTRLAEAEELVAHHTLDSLTAVRPILSRTGSDPTRSGPQTLVDVGSGNGYPGLALAIAMPSWTVVLVERVARKAAFLRHAAGRLGLRDRVFVQEEDVTHLLPDDLPGGDPARVIVSRAFAAPEVFLATTRFLASPSTDWLYWAGRQETRRRLGGSFPQPLSQGSGAVVALVPVDSDRSLLWLRP